MTIKDDYFRYLDHIDTSMTMRELFEHPQRPNAIALRHDIDHDLDLALEMAHHEHERGIRATYFLLHTTDYWNDPRFAVKCAQLEAYGHEVGLHLNLLTEWVQGRCATLDRRLTELLEHLRAGGVEVVGTSGHGDRACYEHGFNNYWIWKELRGDQPETTERGLSAEGIPVADPRWQVPYPKDNRLRRDDGAELDLWSISLADHGLAYDAVHVHNAQYWTDTGGGWRRSADPLKADLSTGRHQILMHPHWWRGRTRTYFVLCPARSGSKWLVNFVDQATSCRALHDWTLNHRRTEDGYELDKRTGDDFLGLVESPNLASALIRQAAAHHRSILPGDVLEANVYLEPFLDEFRAQIPDAELIHLHRDGKDVVRSILNRDWYDTPFDRRHRVVPIPEWDELNQFERACWYYRHTQKTLMAATKARISFERMVSDLGYLTRTLRELGIVVHPSLAETEFGKRIDANRRDEFPSYERWPEAYRMAFERICGDVQSALGYEVDERTVDYELGTAASEPPSGKTHVQPVLSMEYASLAPSTVTGVHVRCLPTDRGLEVGTSESGHATAHLVLGRGSWSRVESKDGCVCDPNVFYSARIRFDAAPGAAVRVFLLLYDKRGAQVGKRHVAMLRCDSDWGGFSFTVQPGASHFMLALHFGDQPPKHRITLRSVNVNSIVADENYRVRIPTSARTALAQESLWPAAGERGVEV